MKTSITTTVILLALMFFSSSCVNKDKRGEKALAQENVKAKQLLQGIWLNEDDEEVVFKVQKDTIYYPDSTSIPVYFKIVQDSLILQSSSTVKYSIVRQTAHLFEFKNQNGDVVRLVKSDNPEDEFAFMRKKNVALNQNSLIKRDTVIIAHKERYHLYVQVNPTTYKIVKNSYTDEGVEVGSIYYDNIVHISVYNGANKLFSRDFKKSDFHKFIPQQFYAQCILSDIVFDHLSQQSVTFKAYLPIPDSTASYIIKVNVTFNGKYELSV